MSTKIKNKELIEKIFENNSIDGTDNKMLNGSNTEYKIYKLKDLCPETFDKTDLEKIGDNLWKVDL